MEFKNLKEVREKRGYTQQHIASFLNITQASYSRKERGKRNFELREAFMLEDFFNIPISELFEDLKKTYRI